MSLTDRIGSKSLCIALAPELLSAVVCSGKRIVAHSEIRIPADSDGHWNRSLAAFQAYLRQAGVTLHGIPVSVGIATRWCQLAMLPWSDALLHQDSAQRYQQDHFAGIYGDLACAWSIVCDDAPYGQARLACAIDSAFLDGLRDVARAHGHPRIAVESILSTTARAIGSGRHESFAIIEPGRLVLAALSQGRVAAVQAQACRGPWHTELPQAWPRWMLRTPELGDIAQVALASMDEQAPMAGLPTPFHPAATPKEGAQLAAC